jgi:molecular chaperone GrpE
MEIDALLADFRAWLVQVADPKPQDESSSPGVFGTVDLHTLVSQFVALRHEVNLQTRTSRTQQEQTAETLKRLGEALAALEDRGGGDEDGDEQDRQELLRPLLKTLVDVFDALSLARREVQRLQENLLKNLEQPAPTSETVLAAPSLWIRFLGAGKSHVRILGGGRTEMIPQQIGEERGQIVERVGQLVASVIAGYTMSLQRIERTLDRHGLKPIEAVGRPFDPELMEVVDVVTESSRSGTEVIEEVRRGYLWRDRLFRCAQVRVARPAGPQQENDA